MISAPAVLSPSWDSQALLTKAQRYVEEMLRHIPGEWQYAFWSSLALELIARAALAKISPALLADQSTWNNIYYALGHTPTAPKFVPKSIGVAEVINRLGQILPSFDKELENFCVVHTGNRNAELHSADTPFDGLKSSSWLPLFYRSCEVLLSSVGSTLEQMFTDEESATARKLIVAAKDNAAKSVAGIIKAHKTVWEGKTQKVREKLIAQATVWAARNEGHVVECPACKATALLLGEPISAPKKAIKDDMITETQLFLPSKFECIACGMKISGLSQLSACGLGDPYKRTSTYDAAEYYALEDDFAGYEDDNNEPI